ncbi:hypothetical protein LPB67_12880 [Undibacterium sp. Jales W-56]|uniref:hypothetical protein n=1 Tax=Undibacterium sp. Jales W-56 TaxID=2897325 RepID=UPI0021D3CB26|nr:hypothetical protein [Undibacterium sp. Jales W-56]MCU6434664.1 hypothetical protein [Undibacterium sp. Jales W-56]
MSNPINNWTPGRSRNTFSTLADYAAPVFFYFLLKSAMTPTMAVSKYTGPSKTRSTRIFVWMAVVASIYVNSHQNAAQMPSSHLAGGE